MPGVYLAGASSSMPVPELGLPSHMTVEGVVEMGLARMKLDGRAGEPSGLEAISALEPGEHMFL